MNFFVWSTIILGIWGAVGPLVGVSYGQELSRRFQRAQWLSGNKKQEYKDLITAMGAAFTAWIHYYDMGDKKTLEDHKAAVELDRKVAVTIQSSIFITDELRGSDIFTRWSQIVEGIEGKEPKKAGDEYGTLLGAIRVMAKKNIRS